jgi:hypothetical protein
MSMRHGACDVDVINEIESKGLFSAMDSLEWRQAKKAARRPKIAEVRLHAWPEMYVP